MLFCYLFLYKKTKKLYLLRHLLKINDFKIVGRQIIYSIEELRCEKVILYIPIHIYLIEIIRNLRQTLRHLKASYMK